MFNRYDFNHDTEMLLIRVGALRRIARDALKIYAAFESESVTTENQRKHLAELFDQYHKQLQGIDYTLGSYCLDLPYEDVKKINAIFHEESNDLQEKYHAMRERLEHIALQTQLKDPIQKQHRQRKNYNSEENKHHPNFFNQKPEHQQPKNHITRQPKAKACKKQ